MKQLVCEMCGGTDLIKDGGVFVCQTCGCKYSIEEAKKMMIEGVVDVTGSTIKVDNAQKLENLRKLADRAKEENDTETATKYFEQILLEDPNDWEANFYTIYYAAHNVKIAQLGAAANRVSNCFESVLKVIKDMISNPNEQKAAYMEIAIRTTSFKEMLISNALNHLGSDYAHAVENVNSWIVPAITMVVLLADNISNMFNDSDTARMLYEHAKKDSTILKNNFSEMSQLDSTIASRISGLQKKKNDEYWFVHADEKAALDSEKASHEGQIADLNKQIAALAEVVAVTEIENQIAAKTKEKDSLGLFKGKEKKALQAQIDELNTRLSDAKKAKETAVIPFNESIAKLQSRIKEIDTELTKDR